VGIVGENGVGKSTFIKMLQGLVAPDSGHFDVGETVKFGYYSQDGITFNRNQKVIDAVTAIAEDIELTDGVRVTPMQFLQHFLFSVADQQKYIHTLSGGELCRLHLATVLMRRPNFLILDEPTNDLDIVTLGILEEYLCSFKGCVIIISHDRFFLDSIVDHLFVMEGDGVVKDFPGNYTEYRDYCAELKAAEAPKPQAAAAPEKAKQTLERKAKLSFKERKEFDALTEELDTLNAEKAELEQLFNSGEAVADIAEKSQRYNELNTLLDEKELRWLELSEKA
jgi:ATP-binding cassette subfamily F protein uup